MLGLVVASSAFILCALNASSSASEKRLDAGVAQNTKVKVKIVGKAIDRPNKEAGQVEYGNFLTFEAIDKRQKLLNDGELDVPRSIYVRAQWGQTGTLVVNQSGQFQDFRPA